MCWAALKPILGSRDFWRGVGTFIKYFGKALRGLVEENPIVKITVWFLKLFNLLLGMGPNASGAVDSLGASMIALAGPMFTGGSSAGKSFADGMVDGINDGTPGVTSASSAMGAAALAAFKSVLGIASPSKVMMQMGGHMGVGLEGGLDQSQGKVGSAAADLGQAAAGGAAAGASKGPAAGSGKAKAGLSIGDVHLHVADAGHPAAWAEEAFAALLERLGSTVGV